MLKCKFQKMTNECIQKLKEAEDEKQKFQIYDELMAMRVIHERRLIQINPQNNALKLENILGVFYREQVDDEDQPSRQ